MNRSLLSTLIVCGAFGSANLRAQNCDGTGATLDLPDTVAIGEFVTALMHAPPPATTILLMASLGDGPNSGGSYGTLCLDFPPVLQQIFVLDANGDASLTEEIPCDPGFIGQTFYVQFITCSPGKGRASHGSSNMKSVTIVDGIGTDSFCTFTQEDFNLECGKGSPAGCYLRDHFEHAFPNGVLIGDQDGDDADQCYAALWTRAGTIENFLIQDYRCAQLDGDRKDPKGESGFKFGAELLVAKLNLGFDDSGIYDSAKCRVDRKVGDLVFIACVDEHLIGWSVRQLIDFADLAICGELGAGPFDLDGDQKADVTCDDLMDALEVFNGNFRECSIDNGCLGIDS